MTDLPLTLFISSPLCIALAVGRLVVQVLLTQNQFLSYLNISLDSVYENIYRECEQLKESILEIMMLLEI